MHAIGGEKRQRVLVCEFDLSRMKISKLLQETLGVGEEPHRRDNVMFGAGNNHDVCHWGAEVGPASHSGIEGVGAWQVDLGSAREVPHQLRVVHTIFFAIPKGLETWGRDASECNCYCRQRQEGGEFQLTVMHWRGGGNQRKRVTG